MMEDIEMLLKEFEDIAIKYSDAQEEGKYKIVNKNYDKMINIVRLLGRNHQVCELKRFLNYPHNGVRSCAATYLLPIDEKMALKVLKEVVKAKEPLISFDAEIVIQEWKNGNLKAYLIKLVNGDEV